MDQPRNPPAPFGLRRHGYCPTYSPTPIFVVGAPRSSYGYDFVAPPRIWARGFDRGVRNGPRCTSLCSLLVDPVAGSESVPDARVMGIDYGVRRIGIALSDPTWALATPLTTFTRRRGKRPPLRSIEALVQHHGVGRIVVGLPLWPGKAETEWIREVREFAAKLAKRVERPVELQDEAFSSVEAEAKLRSIGLPRKQREDKGRIDAAAATIILQRWLDGNSKV